MIGVASEPDGQRRNLADRDQQRNCHAKEAPRLARRFGQAGQNRSARGAYVLAEAKGGARRATIMATGSAVAIALAARRLLPAEGLPTAVVSMPRRELFRAQGEAYRSDVLHAAGVRVTTEAGVRHGWERRIGERDGLPAWMAAVPRATATSRTPVFGITAGAVAAAVRARLQETWSRRGRR